jgi:hypothetical protein
MASAHMALRRPKAQLTRNLVAIARDDGTVILLF